MYLCRVEKQRFGCFPAVMPKKEIAYPMEKKTLIRPVTNRREMKTFAALANRLYEGCEYYVPDLEFDVCNMFDGKKNPAFEFCDAQLFIAYKDNVAVGRVAAMINHRANEKWNVRNVRFGYLDFIDDDEVSRALLDAVEQWGRERGMTHCQGPMGFTDFDKEGMLVEGFDKLGSMTTFYNYPYYPEHLERHGYKKEVDWVQIRVAVPQETPEKFVRVGELVKKRYNLRVVKLNGRMLFKEGYGQKVFNLLNEAYEPLFGFSALSQRQMDEMVKQYFQLINMDLVTTVQDEEGNVVAVGVTMGSLSNAIRKSKGRLLPLGWWHILRSLRFKMEDTVEMLLIAVKHELQGKGVTALLFSDLIPIYNKYKFKWAETNPQLETNHKELNQWDVLNPTFPKRRRCYHKALAK